MATIFSDHARRMSLHALPRVGGASQMPGKRWTRQEKRSLRQQIAAGMPLRAILIGSRTWAGIRYMLRVLRIHWSNRWTRTQTRSLVAQIKQGNNLSELRIA